MDYNYGDAYLRYPCNTGIVCFGDGSMLKAQNIHEEMPTFMANADVIFTDSPWNQGNLTAFYRKAGIDVAQSSWALFKDRLFECVGWIDPKVCYLEIGKEYLADYIVAMRRLYKHVTFYNSTYYHKRDNICYVVRGSKAFQKPKLDWMDEEDIIEWVCRNEEYNCIGDLCMGRGLVAVGAAKAGRRFVGTELNPKRLSVAIERLVGLGKAYTINKGEMV